jgi:hypothetical protein
MDAVSVHTTWSIIGKIGHRLSQNDPAKAGRYNAMTIRRKVLEFRVTAIMA